MEDRQQEPPGAAPRLILLVFMSTTRETMDSVLQVNKKKFSEKKFYSSDSACTTSVAPKSSGFSFGSGAVNFGGRPSSPK